MGVTGKKSAFNRTKCRLDINLIGLQKSCIATVFFGGDQINYDPSC